VAARAWAGPVHEGLVVEVDDAAAGVRMSL